MTSGKGANFIPQSHMLATINAVPKLGEDLEKKKEEVECIWKIETRTPVGGGGGGGWGGLGGGNNHGSGRSMNGYILTYFRP